jgi:glycosyltransferase involved in cell wall biosynthesis
MSITRKRGETPSAIDLNILIYSKPYWPSVGGVESSSSLLARSLAESGHIVRVFTSTGYRGLELNEGYDIRRSSDFLNFVRAAMVADVVVIKGGVSAFAGLGAILARVAAVVIWHEMAGSYLHPGNTWIVRLTNIIRDWVVQRSCTHVGVTEASLNSKHLPDGSVRRVICNPVDSRLSAAAKVLIDCHRGNDILFVGRLFEGKGIFVLAEALRQLDADGLSLRVSIVGDGSDRLPMSNLLCHLRTCSVTFTGTQTGRALAESYAFSKLLVVPSTTPEGGPMVIAEGMTFGLPVVASDQPALKELVGDAGIIVRTGDAEGLASAMRKILSEDEVWHDLSARARLRSELFTTSTFRRRVDDLLQEVCQRC